jgi:LysM repeat protein
MLSPNLTQIGAGVAVSGGRGYYVIDCARPAGAGSLPSNNTTTVNGTPVTRSPSDIMSPVIVSTPRNDGAVYHDVKFGQTLWSIAIAYGTTIEQIKLLNRLGSNDIYPGQQLLIMTIGTLTPTIISATDTPEKAAATATSVDTATPVITETSAPTEVAVSEAGNNGSIVVGAIILIALLAAGLGTWLGTKKAE